MLPVPTPPTANPHDGAHGRRKTAVIILVKTGFIVAIGQVYAHLISVACDEPTLVHLVTIPVIT